MLVSPAVVSCLLQSCCRKDGELEHLVSPVPELWATSSATFCLEYPFSSLTVARYTCLLFFKNIVDEVSDILGQGLLATASKLHDIKFWLMLCSGCGCQLWVIMSAFGKHLLCLCTWRMISGTCSSTAAPLPCHVLSPQLSQAAHEEPGFTRMELLSCLKSWVNIHPYPGFRYSKRHSFGWTQNWTSGESPRDFKVHWLI